MDTVLSDYAQWLGISWGEGARDFEHGRDIEDFLGDILKERAKFEQWKAGDRKTRAEDEAAAAAAQERRGGMTDEEFAEEDAWVRASEVRRVEAERMGEQDDLSDMPDFSREQLLFSRGSRPYNKKQNKRNLNLSSGRTGSRTTESSSLDQRSVVAAQNSLASVDSVANVLPEAQGDVAKSRGQAPLAPRPSHFGRDDNQLSVAIAQKMATTRITIQHQGGISSSSSSSIGSQPIFIMSFFPAKSHRRVSRNSAMPFP